MTLRFGVHVRADVVTAVATSAGRIAGLWRAERGGEPLDSTLDHLFASVPRMPWRRPSAVFAVGPSAVQSKRITGLPAVRRAELPLLVQENAPRFFIGDTSRLRFAAFPADHAVITEAFEREVVSAIESAAARAKLGSAIVASSACVLAAALGEGEAVVADADCALRVTCRGGIPVRLTRTGVVEQNETALPGSDDIEPEYAVAHAAATSGRLVPGITLLGSGTETPRWRGHLALIALAVALTSLLAAPFVSVSRARAAAEREARAMDTALREAAATRNALLAVTAELQAVADFARHSRSQTTLLAALTQALPSQSALVALTVDSAGGSVVVVADPVGDVLARLDTLALIASPQLAGPITRERYMEREHDRATIRFAWNGAIR